MKQLFSVLLALAAWAPSLYAQDAANVPHTLTLDGAIKAAIDRNYTVRTSHNAERIASIDVTKAKDNMWLPSVNGSAGWGYDYSLSPLSVRTHQLLVPGDTLTGTSPQTVQVITPAGSQSLNWKVGASLNLYNGGGDIAKVRAAEADQQGAEETFTWTRQVIAYNVTSAYLNVLRTKELVIAADTTIAQAMAQLNLISGKYQAGVVPIGQVYQQQTVVSQDSLALIQDINAFENAKADVLFLMNVSPNEYDSYTFTVTGIDTTMANAGHVLTDTNLTRARLDAVIDARPDIQSQRQAIQATEFGVDAIRAGLLPSLNASAGIGGAGGDPDLTKIHIDNSLNVGLSLNVPIFDKMQTRLAVEEQEVNVENQRIKLEQVVQQMRSDAAKAVNDIRASANAISASETALTSANESLRLAMERLRVGAGTQVDVIIAESAVESARVNYVNAKFNYVLAQRQLAFTLGPWNY